MPVGEAIVKYAPEKAAKVFQALNTTEVKIVARDFNEELGKAMNRRYAQNVAYSGAPWVDDVGRALRATIAKAAGGELSSWAIWAKNAVVNARVYRIVSRDGIAREFLMLETESGPIAFYRSSGRSTPLLKKPGEWQIFAGFAPDGRNITGWIKTPETIGLVNGRSEYLTEISLALEKAQEEGLLGQLKLVDLTSKAAGAKNRINWAIREMNNAAGKDKYMYYREHWLSEAYANKALEHGGSLEGTYGKNIFPESASEYVGLNNIRSERLAGGVIKGKILPSLERIKNFGYTVGPY